MIQPMRTVAISDLHGRLPLVPPCELLVIAGDICPHFADVGTPDDVVGQAAWLDGKFRAWLDAVPATEVVATWGNHDFVGEAAPHRVPRDLRWRLLVDAADGVLGLRVYGTPWQPWFGSWAFNGRRDDPDETFLAEKFAAIPDDTDLLICHAPPRGFGDRTVRGVDTGSTTLARRIAEVAPSLSIHGHIHEGRGQWTLGPTTIANVSVLDEHYRLVHPPMVFDLDDKDRRRRLEGVTP